MKNSIPRYTFYKNKYGSELLVDVVELKYVKKFLALSSVHTLTYYDITFVTEGEGMFSIDNQTCEAVSRDEFLSSLFKDSLFVQHLSFFKSGKTSSKLQLSDELYMRILQILYNIKAEIDSYKQNDVHVLRALLYEVLMLLNRAYQKADIGGESTSKETNNIHINKFIKLVDAHLKEQHSVQYYADKLCITPNYLNEIVTSIMGLSAKQYIQNKVMDESKRLLAYTDSSISDIAFELHFSTVSYFIRCFRQHTGETPLLYRKTHKP